MAIAHEERVPYKEHPPLRTTTEVADWRVGCFGSICYDAAFAFEALLCFPCAAGYLSHNVDSGKLGMDWTPCCAICTGCYICPLVGPCVTIAISHQIRTKTKDRYKIREAKESCCDKMIGCCCPVCSLCQVHTELVMRGEANGTMCSDASPNYTLEKWSQSRMAGVNPNQVGTNFHSPSPAVNHPSHPTLHASYDGNNPNYQHPNPHHHSNNTMTMFSSSPPPPHAQPVFHHHHQQTNQYPLHHSYSGHHGNDYSNPAFLMDNNSQNAPPPPPPPQQQHHHQHQQWVQTGVPMQ